MPRNGKIARLPIAVRHALNQRLFNGQPGPDILNWANALPEVQSILVQHFAGHPINLQNLSEWRQGGFEEWLLREDISLQAGRCGEAAENLTAVAGHVLENLCTLLGAKYVDLFYEWDRLTDEQLDRKLRQLGSFSRQILALRKLDHEKQKAEFAARKAKAELEAIQRRQAELTAPEDDPGDEEPESADEEAKDQSPSSRIKPHQTGSKPIKPAAAVATKPDNGATVAPLRPEFRVPVKDQTASNRIKLSPDFLSLDPVPRLRPIHRDANRRIIDEVVEKICAGREVARV